MRFYLKKAAALGFLVFLGLWIVGSIRGLTLPYPPPLPITGFDGSDREFFSSSRGNYANNLKQIGLTETPLPLVLDNPNVEKIRIVEKTANLSTQTSNFDSDEATIRSAIKDHQAQIFNGKNAGIEPGRRLMLEIGVNPERFDSLIAELQKVATLASISVEQKDRTSEFRKLFAQRQALKKYLEAMTKLRDGKNLSFDESLRLEQKIQDLEKELQTLSVQFGDLLGQESFYHVHITLAEFQPGDRRDQTYTIPQRIAHAFAWAVVWLLAVALAAGVVVATGVSVWILRQSAE